MRSSSGDANDADADGWGRGEELKTSGLASAVVDFTFFPGDATPGAGSMRVEVGKQKAAGGERWQGAQSACGIETPARTPPSAPPTPRLLLCLAFGERRRDQAKLRFEREGDGGSQ